MYVLNILNEYLGAVLEKTWMFTFAVVFDMWFEASRNSRICNYNLEVLKYLLRFETCLTTWRTYTIHINGISAAAILQKKENVTTVPLTLKIAEPFSNKFHGFG